MQSLSDMPGPSVDVDCGSQWLRIIYEAMSRHMGREDVQVWVQPFSTFKWAVAIHELWWCSRLNEWMKKNDVHKKNTAAQEKKGVGIA